VKPGVRAVGIAESYTPGAEESTLAAAVVRADRVLDGVAYGRCTVGGLDATASSIELLERLDRPDARVCLLGAVAPAWYNLVDIEAIAEATGIPVIAVTFESSDGLEDGLGDAFSGTELTARLDRYRTLPPRRAIELEAGPDTDRRESETVYVRTAGLERADADRYVRAFTPVGGRPEPLRLARLLARAADDLGANESPITDTP